MCINVSVCDMGAGYMGEYHAQKQAITLSKDNGADLQRQTLLHEILHGCLENVGVQSEHDEATINAMACQLLYVLQNNHVLLDYLINRDVEFPTE